MSQLQVTGEAKIRDIQGPVVANSGVVTALDGAASQYVRGDGTLADFPTSTGGGSSVSYYLNSSVSQGTIGGVAYRELSKEPIIGAGTDITISANGYVASYITDANDPDVTIVPGGNFNCEFYFSVNNNTGNPTTYAELYKYDGTTFTLLGSSQAVPESLNQGTTIAPYYFAIPVATAALALTDRLAIRIYVNVDGRTVTLHTENSHLCQVVTTFSKGMVSLNNLTDQSQFITTGTSGTNFNIVSSGDTHTFNLPVASATNTGKLSNTDWSTFNNKQAALSFTAPLVNTSNTISIPAATSLVDGYLDNLDWVNFNTAYNNMIVSAAVTGTTTKTLTLTQQDAGTITASWTDDNTDAVTSVFGRTGAVVAASGDYTTTQVTEGTNLYFTNLRAQNAITLTTTGTSGAATYSGGTLNIPQYQGVLTNPVTGTGTTNTLPKFTGTSAIGNSNITDTGSLITLGSNSYVNGALGIGSTSLTGVNLRVSKNITGQFINSGGSFGVGILSDGQIQSDEVGGAAYYRATINTQAATFTAGSVSGYAVEQGTIGASSVISNQYGFVVGTSLIGATNNYGFASFIPSGINRWNLYMAGTANNYMAGSLGIGSTSLTSTSFRVSKSITGSTISYGVVNDGVVQSGVTSNAVYYQTNVQTAAASFTLNNIYHNYLSQGTFGAGSSVTNQYGVFVDSSLTGATNNYGFFGNIAAATNRWNLYMNGTASNYLAGKLLIGSTTDSGEQLQVTGTAKVTGAATFSSSVTATSYIGEASTTELRLKGGGYGGSYHTSLRSGTGAIGVLQLGNNGDNYILAGNTAVGGYLIFRVNCSSESITSGIEAMRITTGGNVGIGTSSPTNKLHIDDGNYNTYALRIVGSGVANNVNRYTGIGFSGEAANTKAGIFFVSEGTAYSRGALVFANNSDFNQNNVTLADERMRITSSGRVGIGQTSPGTALSVAGQSEQWQLALTTATGTAGAVIGSPSANVLAFGDWSGTERMRITSGGNVLIGTTTDESYKLYVNGGSANAGLFYTTSAANQIKAAGTAPAITFTNTITSPTIGGTLGAATSANQFLTGTSAGDVVLINNYSGNRVYVVSSSGGVYLTSGATSWTANSDIRLKNINSHIENAVEKLSTLQTINFSYKDDKNNKQNLGLIAQEVEKIFPELIDKNGDDMLGVRYTELVPVLIKAIQELELRIKQLENK